MNATEALRAARAVGLELELDGDSLLLEAAVTPPTAVIDAVSQHKHEIVQLLSVGRDGWCAEDWWGFFDERARTVAFSGGLSRTEAEARAYECCVVEWLNRNPEPSAEGQCAWCGGIETRDAVVLPYGTEPGTHSWLHAECWAAWHAARRRRAMEALSRLGLPAGFDQRSFVRSSPPNLALTPKLAGRSAAPMAAQSRDYEPG